MTPHQPASSKPPFKKVLVANRAEIAVRVIRALRELGIESVAVFSEADRDALHVRFATEAYCIGPAPSNESYLRADKILEVALASGAEAIHPGYGFLSENAAFAEKVEAAGLKFFGPSSKAILTMGDKLRARAAALESGAPIVPGTPDPVETVEAALIAAKDVGYPIMLKASAGGGGKGMRIVRDEDELKSAFDLTRGEAQGAFGDATVYLERYIEMPRHIEIQVFGDTHGNIVHLGERECSLQRRHQKVIEEAPSMVVDEALRAEMGEAAIKVARSVDYVGAGTVEFIMDQQGEFFFLEMNTRLQVEHPVTELVYNVDLVHEQIQVAAGQPLSWKQEDLSPKGWAIECRIYAEDPFHGFLPSLGTISQLRMASGPGIRNDMGVHQGFEVSRFYDPMLGKLIAYGADREMARKRMSRALREIMVAGLRTNIAYHRRLVNSPEFIEGRMDTGLLEREFQGIPRSQREDRELAAIVAAVLATHEEARRTRPTKQSDSGAMSAWKLAGRGRKFGR
ncbi:MAG: acetyl-CoA carboxylase biotin carboxylase subunit [Candidatus Eisenbacteria bacterium]|uniref:Acetyl-CoA carboxylase biotin carboxylase subunit n=1 Tax=Eiseniibacteriota bacterium TaxID=2212470 RepID=A0A7Y2E6I0_UNCEI|nr:acetyl-CoA carboxylase biotin carboxylase subunit [Candidatus Eisenbacteria bacterium]